MVINNGHSVPMQQASSDLETRTGFFDIAFADGTNHVSQVTNNVDTHELSSGAKENKEYSSDSSSECCSAERDITDSPIELESMPTNLPPLYQSPKEEVSASTRTEKIIDRINKKLPTRIIRRILKCSIAYFVATLFSTIHILAKAFAPAPFIICSGCLFCHPGRTVGSQLDASITSATGATFAIAYGLAGLEAATAYNVSHPDSHAGAAINCLFLVVGVFFAQLLRQKFPKLHFFSMQFMLVQLFALTNGVGYTEVPKYLPIQYGLAFLTGNIVSLFVNVIFWPESAVDGLGRALCCTLYDTRQMVDTISRQFFLDPKTSIIPAKEIDCLAGRMRAGMAKMNTAYKEAKYELSYAFTSSSKFNPIRCRLKKITKYLSILSSSLKTERLVLNELERISSLNEDREESDSDSLKEDNANNSPTNSNNACHHSQHTQDSLTREVSLRKSALQATHSYIKNGSYKRPYRPNFEADTPSSSKLISPKTSSNVDVQDDKSNNNNNHVNTSSTGSVNEDQHNTPQHTSLQSSNIPNSNFTGRDDLNESDNALEKRKSVSKSIKSIFSAKSNGHRSDYNSSKEEEENSHSEINQNTATSLKSILNLARLSGPKPTPPPKCTKKVMTNDKELLTAYLEKLRGPMLSLAIECAAVLDCVRESIMEQVGIPIEEVTGVKYTSFWRYILHTLGIKGIHKKKDLPNYIHKTERDVSFVCNCAQTMRLRIAQFDKCEKDRMSAIYKLNVCHMRGERLETNLREELFFVFFFIFSFREVASELEQMAEEVRKIQIECQVQIQKRSNKKRKKHVFLPQITIQTWKKWFYSSSYQNNKDRGGYTFAHLQQHMPSDVNQRDMHYEYRLTQIASNQNNDYIHSSEDEDAHSTLRCRGKKEGGTSDCNNNLELAQLESGSPPKQTSPPPLLRLRYKLWLCTKYIQSYEFKFALKLSACVGALTVPVYIPGYRNWFNSIRGQWAALTVIAIMSPTSGGTLASGLWRLAGTFIGAFTAWAVLAINDHSGVLLSGIAFVIAVPFFYIQFSTSYSKVSVVALISYMLMALSQYVSPDNSESVSALVWQRTATLIVGLLAALFLNWMVWPFVARDAVRETLASTINDMGDYYSYVMGTFLFHNEELVPTKDEFEEAERIERKLEKRLLTCNELLEMTDHEPRLKGPFPKEFYKEMLASARNLLDRTMTLRVSLVRMPPEVKKTVRDLDKHLYRRDMVASILLHFYTLSAALKAKIPLPSFMPSARAARSRFLKHRPQEDRPEKLLKYRNLTWFALSASTEEIIFELEHLTDLVRFIVGESKFATKARRIERKNKLI